MALDKLPHDIVAHVLVPYLTLLDANTFRLVSRAAHAAVLSAPMEDGRTPVTRPAAWRRAFPRARAVGLTPSAASDSSLCAALAGVTRVAVVGGTDFEVEVAAMLSSLAKQRRRRALSLNGDGGGWG